MSSSISVTVPYSPNTDITIITHKGYQTLESCIWTPFLCSTLSSPWTRLVLANSLVEREVSSFNVAYKVQRVSDTHADAWKSFTQVTPVCLRSSQPMQRCLQTIIGPCTHHTLYIVRVCSPSKNRACVRQSRCAFPPRFHILTVKSSETIAKYSPFRDNAIARTVEDIL
jgi:hypothetical protein